MKADQLATAGLAGSLFFLLLLGVVAIVQTIRVGRWRHRCDLLQVMYREKQEAMREHRAPRRSLIVAGRRAHRTGAQHAPTAVMPRVLPGEETVRLPEVTR